MVCLPEETRDPRFRSIAMKHANTLMNHAVRPDGSVSLRGRLQEQEIQEKLQASFLTMMI